MGKLINLAGVRFERVTVLRRAGVHPTRNQVMWDCVCDCGKEITACGMDLRTGHTKSCGCFNHDAIMIRNHKHGKTRTPTWNSWSDMMKRCYKPYRENFKHYGGRGISVCVEWHEFEKFFSDMGERPDGMSIERIDNNGNYSPDNCKWATNKEQGNNRRTSRRIEHEGETLTLTQWADKSGVTVQKLWQRLNYGIPFSRAILPQNLKVQP